MAASMDKAVKNIAQNIKELRKKRNLTQGGLAKRSGVTRSAITLIESGSSNPTLEILFKISKTLCVSIDELISSPYVKCRHVKAMDIPHTSKRGVLVRKLLPDKIYATEIDELCLNPGAIMTGTPHITGTKEYFTCIEGQVTIYVLGQTFQLKKGDVLSFPGDKAHSYKNGGETRSRGISIVFPYTDQGGNLQDTITELVNQSLALAP